MNYSLHCNKWEKYFYLFFNQGAAIHNPKRAAASNDVNDRASMEKETRNFSCQDFRHTKPGSKEKSA